MSDETNVVPAPLSRRRVLGWSAAGGSRRCWRRRRGAPRSALLCHRDPDLASFGDVVRHPDRLHRDGVVRPIGVFPARHVIGGVGTLVGPIVGAALFLLLREGLARFFTEFYLIPLGAIFVAIVIFMPHGLLMRRWLSR